MHAIDRMLRGLKFQYLSLNQIKITVCNNFFPLHISIYRFFLVMTYEVACFFVSKTISYIWKYIYIFFKLFAVFAALCVLLVVLWNRIFLLLIKISNVYIQATAPDLEDIIGGSDEENQELFGPIGQQRDGDAAESVTLPELIKRFKRVNTYYFCDLREIVVS